VGTISGMNAVGRDFQTLFEVGTVGGIADGQLLDRFIARREEAVFAAIIQRHGPMVWRVCRRILRDHHDAEEAFQATFLVLTRKAATVKPRDMVGNWLYGVAYQTARKARATRAKRRAREIQVPDMPEPEETSDDLRHDLTEFLDQELSRLPDKYRVPIVLCELEGKTHGKAAEQLGWPIGTLSGRLSRARAMLAKRMVRYGRPATSGSLAMLLARDAASASMPTNLIGSTTTAASLFAAGQPVTAGAVSANVAALTQGVLKTMLLCKLRKITLALLALALAGAGVWQTRTRADAKTPLDESFRTTVREVINDESTIVSQIEIETLPGAWVEVVADKAGRGGGGIAAPTQSNVPSIVQVLIFGDHVEWKAGSTNALKFMLKLKAGGALAGSSGTGPMPEAKKLADVLNVVIKSGEYKYEVARKLAVYKDVTYSLVVKKTR
jgi:RNA polymerase sigma factor (sigma-70 family)